MSKKIYLALFGSLLVVAGVLIFSKLSEPGTYNSESPKSAEEPGFHNAGFFELKSLIQEKAVLSGLNENKFIQIGITSHHLPVALDFILDFYRELKSSAGPRDVFVILGPDHFEKCKAQAATTLLSYLTPFGELPVDNEIAEAVRQNGAALNDECFEGEYSIGAQAVLIKYFFPKAKIVPIIFSASAGDQLAERLAQALTNFKDKAVFLASVDFSHYLDRNQSELLDKQSETMLKQLNFDFWNQTHCDSPASAKLIVALAQNFGDRNLKIKRANSFDFTGESQSTTGYISALFY